MSEEKKVEIVEDVEGYLEEDESDVEIEKKPRVRKPKTEKQMAAFKLISEKRKENVKLRQAEGRKKGRKKEGSRNENY